MTDYQSSSSKDEKKQVDIPKKTKLEPVIQVRKRSLFWKLVDAFMPVDMKLYKKNLLNDIIVPSIKKQIDDAVHTFLWSGKSSPTSSAMSKVNYNVSWKNGGSAQSSSVSRKYSGLTVIDDLPVKTYRDGEKAIAKLNEVLREYGKVRVADLCELCDIDSNYPDNNYGWTNLAGAEVVSTYDGYCLKLPKPIPLD